MCSRIANTDPEVMVMGRSDAQLSCTQATTGLFVHPNGGQVFVKHPLRFESLGSTVFHQLGGGILESWQIPRHCVETIIPHR